MPLATVAAGACAIARAYVLGEINGVQSCESPHLSGVKLNEEDQLHPSGKPFPILRLSRQCNAAPVPALHPDCDGYGGPFPPHASHQRGVDIDVWFFGYNDLDDVAARFMLDLLNQSGVIKRVDLLFAAYNQADGAPFWEEIRDVTLVDGRSAGEVFVSDAEHTGHFHLRLRE